MIAILAELCRTTSVAVLIKSTNQLRKDIAMVSQISSHAQCPHGSILQQQI